MKRIKFLLLWAWAWRQRWGYCWDWDTSCGLSLRDSWMMFDKHGWIPKVNRRGGSRKFSTPNGSED